MIKWMDDCVYEVPETCLDIIDNMDKLTDSLVNQFTKKSYKNLLLVGSGSSYNIALCSKFGLEELLDISVNVMYSATYTYTYANKNDDTFVLLLSQGGRSTNTIEAITASKKYKLDFAVLTMDQDTPIKDLTKNHYIYGSHKPGADVFVSRGLPTSIMYLQLFGMKSSLKNKIITKETYDSLLNDLKQLILDLPSIHKKTKEFYEKNIEDFHTMSRVMLIGIQEGYGLALEGALKLSETVGLAANAYETEEFLHGPVYEVKKDHSIFVIDTNDKLHNRTLEIFDNLDYVTDRKYLITSFEDRVGDNVLYLGKNSFAGFSPLKFVIPFQLISSFVYQELRVAAITIDTHRFGQKVVTKL